MTQRTSFFTLFCAVVFSFAARGQFSVSTNSDNTITITGYSGPGGNVIIPANLNGLVVSSIGTNAFFNVTNLTSITIPDSVTSIQDYAFYYEVFLTNATLGNGVRDIGV